jgi:glycerol-3-phosphate dehydrogenase
MWHKNWREEIWTRLTISSEVWDLLIVGGGVTGAGILREATRLGLRALLVEQKDFAWGTSSRSSRLVHGGFRYLKQGKLGLTWASVHEREQLIQDGPGLIDPMGFLMSIYKGDFPGRWTMEVGLTVYDLLALRWDHNYYRPEDLKMLAPHISQKELECGFRYGDAQTDDARLVLRIIREAISAGGFALNYAAAEELIREESLPGEPAQVVGARIKDRISGNACPVRAKVVVNATGVWADRLRGQVGASPRIRPLRGSHLIFPAWRLPVAQAISLWHPVDGRPVFIFPWEGITLVGTTDVDHSEDLDSEPGISPEEVAYLMAVVDARFPSLGITLDDVISTYSGVRPVIGTGKADPSRESRDHVLWEESGLLTITGGKLTTFRLIALDVLNALRSRLPEMAQPDENYPVLDSLDPTSLDGFERPSKEGELRAGRKLDKDIKRRLLGRYGADAPALLAAAQPQELDEIPHTNILWAEVRWAARSEGVVHLDDLLLRRVRVGLLLPEGARAILPAIRSICQPELGWDDHRWENEESAYLSLWRMHYSLPERAVIPDWKGILLKARARRLSVKPARRRKIIGSSVMAAMLLTAVIWLSVLFFRRRRRSR